MRALSLLAVLCVAVAAPAFAAEDTSRTYAKRSCSERNANPNDCVIENGPPRRTAFGAATPEVPSGPKAPAQPPASKGAGGGSVLILGK